MRVSNREIDRIYINSAVRTSDTKMNENHFHFYYEVYYLRQGECQMYISNQPFTLTPGDFVIVPPREVHINHYKTTCERINIYFRSSDLMDGDQIFCPAVSETILRPGITHIPSAYRDKTDELLERMLQEDKISDANTPIMMQLMFRIFLIDAARWGIHREVSSPAITESNREILEAVKYIREHYNRTITLETLAKQAGLSMTYFSHKFLQVTGMGMKEYLTFVRLSNAEKELLSTNHTITQVAENCGFSNPNYFKDAFKKTYSLSPKAYRKSKLTDLSAQESLLNAENAQMTLTKEGLSSGT